MKNIVLFASQGNNIGKSSTAKNLSELLAETTDLYSFADPIRDHCNTLFEFEYKVKSGKFTDYYSNRSLKNKNIYDTIKDESANPKLTKYTFRTFINDMSDEYQKLKGKDVWAKMAVDFIQTSSAKVILIDDFRRDVEGNFLIENLNPEEFNLIFVFLIKEGIKDQVDSSYEGLLKDFSFDITFNINSDYSNMPELYEIITSKLKD